MAFENLQEKLTRTLKNIQGKGKFSEKNMEDTLREIRVAMLEADVNYTVVKDFLASIKEKVLGQEVLISVEPGEALIKIVHDELIALLGEEASLNLIKEDGIARLMIVGLQGTGKTTQLAKIANHLKKSGYRPLLVAGDVIRPAAVEQLKVLGKNISIPVYAEENNNNAVEIIKHSLEFAKQNHFDVLLTDTAGRLQIDEPLMKELSDIQSILNPSEILLTVDALTGQDIVNVAQSFNDQISITGLVVTKFDGDSKGGGVLSVKARTGVPIKFTGIGEKIDDLEVFHPDRLVNRILGMGDIVSLVEKAQEKIDMKKAEEDAKKMLSGKFTMEDLLRQIEQSQKMGPLASIAKMLPGMGEYAKAMEDGQAEKQLLKTKAMIQSMTKEEREDPSLIRSSRKRRIASGSGTTTTDVNRLLSQYEKMKQLMKQMSSLRGMFGL